MAKTAFKSWVLIIHLSWFKCKLLKKDQDLICAKICALISRIFHQDLRMVSYLDNQPCALVPTTHHSNKLHPSVTLNPLIFNVKLMIKIKPRTIAAATTSLQWSIKLITCRKISTHYCKRNSNFLNTRKALPLILMMSECSKNRRVRRMMSLMGAT